MTRLEEEAREFHSQRPTWVPDESGSGLEHATVEVPLDYADPGGRRITLAVSRRRATGPRPRRGILLALNGGPGGDGGLGRLLPGRLADSAPAEIYDLIGFDPRGTGASTRVEGEDSPTTTPFDSRPPDSAFAAITADMRERDLGCERAGDGLRPHITTRNNARDMDVIRAVLGEERLSFVGWAYGTLLGAVYGTMFPGRLDRSVLDSCVHPDWDWREQFKAQAPAVRENVDAWAEWAGRRDRHFGLGTGAGPVLAAVEETADRLAKLAPDAALRTSFDGIIGTLAPVRPRWDTLAYLVRDLREASLAGRAEQCRTLLSGQRKWRPGHAAGELREAVLEAVTCETEWPADLEVYYRDMREFREHCPYGFGVMRAQPWVGTFRSFRPTEPPTRVRRDGYPAGIVVQADGDPWDHHPGAAAMADRLGHSLVTVADSGAHEIYALGGNAAVDAHVDRYLLDGVLPPPRTVCAGAARPDIPED